MIKYILFGAALLILAALWLRSESRRKSTEADLAAALDQIDRLRHQTGLQSAELSGMQENCDTQKTKQQACHEAACNIHLYAQLAAEESATASQKQKQQVILSETQKLLDLLKS